MGQPGKAFKGPRRLFFSGRPRTAPAGPAPVAAGYTSPMDVHMVFCSCPDPETAARLATAVVEERLAACASVLPGMHSVYRWQGAVERADEVLLLAERMQALHPYDLPEVIAVQAAAGLPGYLGWVVEATRD